MWKKSFCFFFTLAQHYNVNIISIFITNAWISDIQKWINFLNASLYLYCYYCHQFTKCLFWSASLYWSFGTGRDGCGLYFDGMRRERTDLFPTYTITCIPKIKELFSVSPHPHRPSLLNGTEPEHMHFRRSGQVKRSKKRPIPFVCLFRSFISMCSSQLHRMRNLCHAVCSCIVYVSFHCPFRIP